VEPAGSTQAGARVLVRRAQVVRCARAQLAPQSLTRRRILLFPQGNANGQPNDMVSVYLEYANPKGAPEGWHACAQFCLAISNVNDPTLHISSRAY
jgi:hypothetical protein